MSSDSKAVFLSYAAQDAEAARKICEALRGAGVEVWFDADGGLEHGDEWDAKIRRQIKECVLFIPVISANTQAREEGYFRLEWDLAAERARTIASGVPFILPVVIDDTREPDALVPDRFRMVQWTRIPRGEVRPEVRARLLKLWSHRTGALAAQSGGARRPAFVPEVPAADRPSQRVKWAVGALAALLVAGAAGWKIYRREQPPTSKSSPGPASAASEADRLVARAAATFQRMNYTREDLAAADLLARKATELAPESAEAWAMRAYVHAAYVWRLWDRSEKRRQEVESLANRALALDSKQVRAMLALAELHRAQRAFAQAEVVARRAIALQPDDPHLFRVLASALDGQEREGEASALRQETARKFPRDALTHYDLGLHYMVTGDFAASMRSFDAALSIEPITSALLNKARLLVAWKKDLAGARRVLDEVAPQDRTELRAVTVAMWLGLLERRLDRVEAAAALTAQTYLETGPKAALLAQALHVAGKKNLAEQQWRAAEAATRQRLRERPDDMWAAVHLAIALVWLDRSAEAAREIVVGEAAVLERPASQVSRRNDLRLLAVLVAEYHASLGDAARAVSFLRAAGSLWDASAAVLSLNPSWDKIRDHPEFVALLQAKAQSEEAATQVSGTKTTSASPSVVHPKSVAVLAFENLSDDKANEYFSDGISEELLDAIGKVPGLRVAGRTSSFSFKGKNVPEAEIARQLGVTHIVSGSVSKSGTEVHIRARLINGADGLQLWSDKFRREAKNIVALQDDIARRVAEELQLKLGTARAARSVNPEAYSLVLEGRHFWNLRGADLENLARAEKSFLAALKIDSAFPQALAGLADVYVIRAWWAQMEGKASEAAQDIVRARQWATEAMRLDDALPEPHAALGTVHFLQGAFVETERAFARSFQNNPSHAVARHWHGVVQGMKGRLDLALEHSRDSALADPRSPNTLWSLATIYNYARRHEEALTAVERSLALRPGFLPALAEKSIACWFLGRKEEALVAARTIARDRTSTIRWWADAVAIFILRLAGHQAEADEVAGHIRATVAPDDYRRGFALAALGKFEEAYAATTQVPTTAWGCVFYHRIWDQGRDDPRFLQMVQRMGCAEQYKAARASVEQLAGTAKK